MGKSHKASRPSDVVVGADGQCQPPFELLTPAAENPG
jgi:hypothetical protein